MDKDQDRRNRAYKIWEEEGRPDGHHDEHWNRAKEEHEKTEQEAAEVTDANQHASDELNNGSAKTRAGIRPPSKVAPD